MAIPAGRAARFGAFAVLASAALLLSVAVPEAIAMEERLTPPGEQQETDDGVNGGEFTSEFIPPEGETSPPPGPTGPVVGQEDLVTPPGTGGFRGFKWLRRGRHRQQERMEDAGDVDDAQKKGFWSNLFGTGKKSGASEGSQPKKRFWTRLNPKTWFRNKEPEPEPAASEIYGQCNLVRMTGNDLLGTGLPTPQYIERNIKRGMNEIKRWRKKHVPLQFRLTAGRWEKVGGELCKPDNVIRDLFNLLVNGVPGLPENQGLQDALTSLLKAVQYRITKSWFSCFRVKVEHKKAECHREELSYKELVAKVPLCPRDVWNTCQTIQAALEANPLQDVVTDLKADAGEKGNE